MPFVLIISERGNSWAGRGPLATTHDSRAEAQASPVEWVKENWDVEMDGDLSESESPEITRVPLDNDGNAFVIALGDSSCAPGPSLIGKTPQERAETRRGGSHGRKRIASTPA